MIAWLMGPRGVPRRRNRPPDRLRLVLVSLVALAAGALAVLIVTRPGRVGLFPGTPGRTASPGEAVWTRLTPAPLALTEVAAAAHQGRVWVAGGLDASGAASARGHGLGAAVINGTAYVVLGGPQPGLTASDVIEALKLP